MTAEPQKREPRAAEREVLMAEPLRTEDSWRVRRSRDGQNVLFRVSKEEAERFVKEQPSETAVPPGDAA